MISEVIETWVSPLYRTERRIALVLRKIRGSLFVDVGAYHGYYVGLLANNFQRVLAIEPMPANYIAMQRILMRKRVFVDAIQAAVSDRDGETSLLFSRNKSGHQIDLGGRGQSTLVGSVIVRTITLSTIVQQFGTIDLAKVDVEGAEWLVLKGAEEESRRIMRWMVELHDLSRKRELENWMHDHLYAFDWVNRNHLYGWKLA